MKHWQQRETNEMCLIHDSQDILMKFGNLRRFNNLYFFEVFLKNNIFFQLGFPLADGHYTLNEAYFCDSFNS